MCVVSHNATSYQWFKDGKHVIGETTDTLSFTNISAEDEGNYFCRCTNAIGSKDTNVARLAIKDGVFTVSFESKDFSSTQDGSAMRTGFLDAQHGGAAGGCDPSTFDYESTTYTIKEVSANQGDDQVRFIVTDTTGLENTSLRLFIGGEMATLTYNGPTSGYIGNNSTVNGIIHSLDGVDSDVAIAILNNEVVTLMDNNQGDATVVETSNTVVGYTADELKSYELDQLRAIAKDLNIKSYHLMKEDKLIESILGMQKEMVNSHE